ncbi:MAG: flagellar hook-basal body complex protein FliE [Desulfobacterales bacterium]
MINNIFQLTDIPENIADTHQANQIKPKNDLVGTFKKIFEETEKSMQNADQAVLKANTNGSVELHEMMIAMEKADISLRLLVQIRNKAIDAYQEIMRMQV